MRTQIPMIKGKHWSKVSQVHWNNTLGRSIKYYAFVPQFFDPKNLIKNETQGRIHNNGSKTSSSIIAKKPQKKKIKLVLTLTFNAHCLGVNFSLFSISMEAPLFMRRDTTEPKQTIFMFFEKRQYSLNTCCPIIHMLKHQITWLIRRK